MDMMETAAAWLGRTLAESASQPVQYCRGQQVCEVRATLGSTSYEVDRGDGLVVQAETVDFLIGADELVFDGRLARPAEGDRIKHRRSGTPEVSVYEVMPLGGSAYRRADVYGGRWRVHTREVERE